MLHPAAFLTRLRAFDTSYIHKACRPAPPPVPLIHRLESQSVRRDQDRPRLNVLFDQFESFTRTLFPLAAEKRERKRASRERTETVLFISHPRQVADRAKGIVETNRPRVERETRTRLFLSLALSFAALFAALLFSYVVFDLGRIDETRDTGGRRRRQHSG